MKSILAGGQKALAMRALNMEHEGSGSPELSQLVGVGVTVTGLTTQLEKIGPFVWLKFTFAAMSLAVTDAAGSGSSADRGDLRIRRSEQAVADHVDDHRPGLSARRLNA